MPRHVKPKTDEQLEATDAGPLRFDALDELLGYHLRRAQGAMHRDYMAAVADLELTQKQTATMWLIIGNPGVSQGAVAATLGMDRATMMALVDRLEDRGLLVRKRSTIDRRRQELHPTPAGQSILRKVRQRIAKHEECFKSRFTAAELASLIQALKKLQGPG